MKFSEKVYFDNTLAVSDDEISMTTEKLVLWGLNGKNRDKIPFWLSHFISMTKISCLCNPGWCKTLPQLVWYATQDDRLHDKDTANLLLSFYAVNYCFPCGDPFPWNFMQNSKKDSKSPHVCDLFDGSHVTIGYGITA